MNLDLPLPGRKSLRESYTNLARAWSKPEPVELPAVIVVEQRVHKRAA